MVWEYFEELDMRGVAVGLIVYLLFMLMIWKGPTLSAGWQFHHQILITLLGLPVCLGMGLVAFQKMG